MSRRTSLGTLLSIAVLAAACSGPLTARTDRPSPGLALAPGVAQFLAPSSITLARSNDGTVRISGVAPAAGHAESRVLAPEVRRVALDQGGLGPWTEALLHGYCRLPQPASVLAGPTLMPPSVTRASGLLR